MRCRTVAVLALCCAAPGCSTLEITADHNPKIDFAALRTWHFKPTSEPLSRDTRLEGRDLPQRIADGIAAQLEDKGYDRAADGDGDFEVGFGVSMKKALGGGSVEGEYETTPAMFFLGARIEPEPGTMQTFDEGSLLIQFTDPKSGKMIWRAWTSSEVNLDRTPRQNQLELDRAIREILERFPP